MSTLSIQKVTDEICPDWSIPDTVPHRDPNSRIVNGVPANLGEFPWQAQLFSEIPRDTTPHYFCGGTLINSKHVLTAANCIFVPKENITVITGRLSKSEFEQQEIISKVAEVIIHPDYNHPKYYNDPSIFNNDIALLVLVERVPFNKNIGMACLFGVFSKEYPNSKAVISGWGTESGSNLKWAYLQLITRDICSEIMAEAPMPPGMPRPIVTEKMICARDNDFVSTGCFGDSGGLKINFSCNSI